MVNEEKVMLRKITEKDIIKLSTAVWLDLACSKLDLLESQGFYFVKASKFNALEDKEQATQKIAKEIFDSILTKLNSDITFYFRICEKTNCKFKDKKEMTFISENCIYPECNFDYCTTYNGLSILKTKEREINELKSKFLSKKKLKQHSRDSVSDIQDDSPE